MPKDKILIAEDNPLNMRMFEMLLRARGYRSLLKAVNGEEALEIAIREKPALVLMDIQLPRMNGLEVTRRLKQIPSLRHIPIIALTAYAMKGDREKFLGAGCDAYLSKPVSTRELPKMIGRILRQRTGYLV